MLLAKSMSSGSRCVIDIAYGIKMDFMFSITYTAGRFVSFVWNYSISIIANFISFPERRKKACCYSNRI